jgi:hypothetical protein
MPWSRERGGGSPCGSANTSPNDASSSSRRDGEAVVVQTELLPAARHRIVAPYCWKDMVRAVKSQVTGPSVPSHCAPRTTSNPAKGMMKRSAVNDEPWMTKGA